MSDGATEMLKEEGTKHDKYKPRLDLIPVSAQLEEAEVLAFGAEKYGEHNWRKGMAWSRPYAAALRHLLAWGEGEDLDPESGISHLAHARCNLGFLLEYLKSHPELDDRPGVVK
jgi:hypothetical protein